MAAEEQHRRQVPTRPPAGFSEASGFELATACPALPHLAAQRRSAPRGALFRRVRAGRRASPAPARARACPGLRVLAARTYQEKQRGTLRAPRHRAPAAAAPSPRAASPARHPSSPASPPARAPGPALKHPPRGPLSAAAAPPCPGARCQVRPPREKWNRKPAREAGAEVGIPRRREARGGLPPLVAHAPGTVTSLGWGVGVAGPAPPSSPSPSPPLRRAAGTRELLGHPAGTRPERRGPPGPGPRAKLNLRSETCGVQRAPAPAARGRSGVQRFVNVRGPGAQVAPRRLWRGHLSPQCSQGCLGPAFRELRFWSRI